MRAKVAYFIRRPLQVFVVLITKLPYFRFVRGTADHQNPITFEAWFKHRILNLGGSRRAHWPVHPTSRIVEPENIEVGVDVCPGLMPGCYIQAAGGISIGDFTQIGPSVGIVSANHDLYDTRRHHAAPVIIGAYCWIGMGAKVLPGVTLGDFTVVAAGAVVTKPFPEGHCVLAGVPARVVKSLDRSRCERFTVKERYCGYLPEPEVARRRERRRIRI